MLKDRRYWIYHIFTAATVATLLGIEDWLEGASPGMVFLEFLAEIPLFFLVVNLISLLAYVVVKWLNRVMPWEKKPFNRFIAESGMVVAIVLALTTVAVAGYRLINNDPSNDNDFAFEIHALIMFFIGIYMVFVFHEFMSLSRDNHVLKLRSETLLKQNYLAKYETLKNQVNPHFLFNSLNVLSSLVYIDAKKADQFIKKFSDVFRYVLELNQEKLVPLKQELHVLDAYLFLQKIRYGSQLNVHQNISAELLDLCVPPLTLQLAVENALKHNAVSKDQVLDIWIEAKENELVIVNTYHFKNAVQESTGIGQKNVFEKYRLLGKRLPQFYLEDGHYIVRLPLLMAEQWSEF
jgi:hypothetical protein